MEAGWRIERLEAKHNTSKIKTGDASFQDLGRFIREEALQSQAAMISNTFVVADADEIIQAYITLLASEVALNGHYPIAEFPKAEQYATQPAVKIARLLVGKAIRTEGVGRRLVGIAADLCMEMSMQIGVRFLIVDAKPQSTQFYERVGFTFLKGQGSDQEGNPAMFFDLKRNTINLS